MSHTVLKNVTLANGSGADIEIENGIISAIGSSSAGGVDCSGLIALPGFVDVHTHLREPGFEASETVLSGTKSAASGGYTAVLAMANTFPVADSSEIVDQIFDLGIASVTPKFNRLVQ